MSYNLVTRATGKTIPVTALTKEGLDGWLKKTDKHLAAWVGAAGFDASAGTTLLLPGKDGGITRILLGVDSDDDIWSWSAAVETLPRGRYAIPKQTGAKMSTNAALGWALGAYVFDRYKKVARPGAELVWPARADRKAVEGMASSIYLTRDLINTPASDLGPAELAAAVRKLAREFKASCSVIVGDKLLEKNYPMVHAVGRASDRLPCLIDVVWGNPRHPKVTLVGKGVCFDSGGLDLKPASGMKLMKKDMGGAANALGLARMIMSAKLPVRLRVLVPAVENSVSGNAFRPLDVLHSRAGITVEIGNTDAEGRLILGDVLYEAASEDPKLILDFATLTGAARIALGPEIPVMFSNNDCLADELSKHGEAVGDPVWRLPIWKPYRRTMDSKVADINNIGDMSQGGAIIAALFLDEFVKETVPWAHFDIMAWNSSSRPGRVAGGEAMAIRAAFGAIAARFGKT
ncbi:MAG: leucyl aminopeptidase family protein [Pseudomonadota bacterium]|nr:leucyl aminopeptidase family protein [Pseudomonadota bacterium]